MSKRARRKRARRKKGSNHGSKPPCGRRGQDQADGEHADRLPHEAQFAPGQSSALA
ncbi:hypothetical protein [Streptomyces racemochromogenes]|uniref:hypothetical protein n=1 Tax=Streptomyces racemochromogenes TaxID=67353 RepID=UPI0031ECAD45